jgi:parallel beta-helix repeat protein
MKKLETLRLSMPEQFGDLNTELLRLTQAWKRAVRVKRSGHLNQGDIAAISERCSQKTEGHDISAPGPVINGLKDRIIDFAGFDFSPYGAGTYALKITGCCNIVLRNIRMSDLSCSGIYIGGSEGVSVQDSELKDLSGVGVVIGDCSTSIAVRRLGISGLEGAGIMIGERTTSVLIEDCIIEHGRGKSNFTAGIVLTDRCCTDLHADPRSIFGPDGYWALQQPIFDRDYIVGQCVIRNNTIRDNLASGIYLDGTFDNIIYDNRFSRNSKEGICFDWGATRNIFAFNLVEGNGQRFGKSDEDLAKDFVLHHGRCKDGTSAAKVPGISVDNSILNCIQYNTVVGNYGSGIKLVRTSFLNNIGYNSCINNNLGENQVNHFFGIEVGAAVPDCPHPKDIPLELDFLPSCCNLVYRNLISGSHFAGIFLDKGTRNNHIFDNLIFDSKIWSIEAFDKEEANHSLNNLAFQDSRNIALSKMAVSIVGLGKKQT